MTIILDLPAEIGLGRLKKKDRLESEPLNFHERIRQEYLQLALLDPERYLVLDGQMSVEDIHAAIISRVADLPALSKVPKKPKYRPHPLQAIAKSGALVQAKAKSATRAVTKKPVRKPKSDKSVATTTKPATSKSSASKPATSKSSKASKK